MWLHHMYDAVLMDLPHSDGGIVLEAFAWPEYRLVDAVV